MVRIHNYNYFVIDMLIIYFKQLRLCTEQMFNIQKAIYIPPDYTGGPGIQSPV